MDNKKKLAKLEDEYLNTQRKIETEIDDVQEEKRELHRFLDNVAGKLNHHADRYEDFTTDKSVAYRVLQEIQGEGDLLVRSTSNKLEHKLQDNKVNYNKQVTKIEEDIRQQKEGDQT